MPKHLFEIPTVSEPNNRDHWSAKNRRKRKQQSDFLILWRWHRIGKPKPPITVTFTRHGHQPLDDDNLRAAFKGIRDQVAKEVGVDDGSDAIEWRYEQVKTPKRANFFEMEIEEITK